MRITNSDKIISCIRKGKLKLLKTEGWFSMYPLLFKVSFFLKLQLKKIDLEF